MEFCTRAIELEEGKYSPTVIKAHFLLGKAQIEHTEYTKATQTLEKLV